MRKLFNWIKGLFKKKQPFIDRYAIDKGCYVEYENGNTELLRKYVKRLAYKLTKINYKPYFNNRGLLIAGYNAEAVGRGGVEMPKKIIESEN